MFQVMAQQLREGENFGFAVDDGQQLDREGVLKLAVLIELVQDGLGLGPLLVLNHDAHALAV